jgi:pimeloyl-ACP methyl ester carboxylesterase
VVCGEQDVITPPEHSRAIAEALPDAELVLVPAAGHLVQLEQPEQVDAPLRKLVEQTLPDVGVDARVPR